MGARVRKTLVTFDNQAKMPDPRLSASGSPLPTVRARKILPLLVLVLSVDADGERADSTCTVREPFLIRNKFRSHCYLTVNLKTNAVNAVENTGNLRQ